MKRLKIIAIILLPLFILGAARKDLRLSFGLPKTGQTVSYATGDDGELEQGWWYGCDNSNNRQRFVEVTIGDKDLVIDYATNLMWPKDYSSGGHSSIDTWSNIMSWAESSTFAGFNDWHIPNILEIQSIIDYGDLSAPLVHSPLDTYSSLYWTSTTDPLSTGDAYRLHFSTAIVGSANKIFYSYYGILVRKAW